MGVTAEQGECPKYKILNVCKCKRKREKQPRKKNPKPKPPPHNQIQTFLAQQRDYLCFGKINNHLALPHLVRHK